MGHKKFQKSRDSAFPQSVTSQTWFCPAVSKFDLSRPCHSAGSQRGRGGVATQARTAGRVRTGVHGGSLTQVGWLNLVVIMPALLGHLWPAAGGCGTGRLHLRRDLLVHCSSVLVQKAEVMTSSSYLSKDFNRLRVSRGDVDVEKARLHTAFRRAGGVQRRCRKGTCAPTSFVQRERRHWLDCSGVARHSLIFL